MSEEKSPFFAPTFNRSVKLRARDQRLSSDGGVLLLREADERLGLVESVAWRLFDPRRQDQIRYHVDELLRERIFSQALGYNVEDEVDLLAHDPAMRIAIWNRPGEQVLDERGASQPTQSRLTDMLANHKENLEALRSALPDWVGRHLRASAKDRAVVRGTLDIDSFPIEVFGSQEGAGYTGGPVLDPLTDDGIPFVGRLKTNEVLEKKAQPYLNRPVGRPPKEGYETIIDLGEHRAESWRHAQRLILVVVDRPDPKTGQLDFFPRHFFLVTNRKPAERTAADLLAHYRRRGTFEDRLGELSQAISPRMSSPRFVENEVNLVLSLLSHNLLSILRGELENESGNGWDVARLQRTVLKRAVRVTKASRRLIVDVALAAVGLWNSLLGCMQRWRLPALCPQPKGARKRRWIPPPRHAFLDAVLRE